MSRACPRCGTEAAAEARFCSSCGAPLDAALAGERKLATMVFADLVGSTTLAANLDPEKLRRRLAPFFDVARAALEEHGGTVEKYIGDAVMAVFGVPRAHGDDPDRAVAAALSLTERVEALGEGLAVRIGIETGEVLASDGVGGPAVTGEAVNAAARLQAAAAPGEVLVGERAALACRAARLERRGPIDAAGFSTPLQAWRAAAGAPADDSANGIPFVGRDEDLDLLRLVYRRAARERIPELVTITGEAGMGKTRLASELVHALERGEQAPRVLIGRNPPYGRGIAFWALAEILRAAAGVGPDASVAEMRAKLAERLRELGAEDAEAVARALAAALGGTEVDCDVEDELRRGWRRLVGLLAGEQPLVVGLDDVHWADDGLLDLVEEAAFRLEDAPVLLLCTARPELLERRPDFGRAARNVTQIELRPLVHDAVVELAGALMPQADGRLALRVAETSGGNPFFAEEVARALEGGGEGPVVERLPDTVQAAISARLDLLANDEKRVIQHAAVLGQAFTDELLADLYGEPPGEVLESLQRKALVQERVAAGPGRYAFRHQLIRDVAYGSLPLAERARLHERTARIIRAAAGERYAELAELIAYHLGQAAELDANPERSRAAQDATREAAEVSVRRGALARAQELHEQAAHLAPESPEQIAQLHAAAEVALRRWRGDEALRLMLDEAEVAERLGERETAAVAYGRSVELGARMGGVTGDVAEGRLQSLLERGRALAGDAEPATRALLLLDEAWIAWRFNRSADMPEPATAALELAREAGDSRLLSSALDAMSACAWYDHKYSGALAYARERLELISRWPASIGREIERNDVLHMLVESLVQCGRFREASRYASEARELDLSHGAAYSGWSRGILPAFFLGEWEEALRMAVHFREAWLAEERPPLAAMAGAMAGAAAIHGYRGDEEGSRAWFAVAENMASEGAQVGGLAMLRSDVDLHHGRPGKAAERLVSPSGGFWWQTAYLATRAEAFVLAGRAEAAEALERVAPHLGEQPYARAIAMRALAQRDDDRDALAAARALFGELECPYQEARTGWLEGGEQRRRAQETFDRLGVPAPG